MQIIKTNKTANTQRILDEINNIYEIKSKKEKEMKENTVAIITALVMWTAYIIMTISCLVLIYNSTQINNKLDKIIELRTPETIITIPEIL